MSGCGRGRGRRQYEEGALKIDLDDEVSRTSLIDCIASGWSAEEIVEELALDDLEALWRWCAYHELERPPSRPASPPPAAPKEESQEPKARATTGKAAPPKKKTRARRQAAASETVEAPKTPAQLKREERLALDQKIAALYQKGMGTYQIARQLKLNTSRVYDALKRQDIVLRRPKTTQRSVEIVKLYRRGQSVKTIAQRYDLTIESVTEALNKMGIKTKRQISLEASIKRRQMLERVAVLALRDAGAGVSEIARQLQYSERRVRKLLADPQEEA